MKFLIPLITALIALISVVSAHPGVVVFSGSAANGNKVSTYTSNSGGGTGFTYTSNTNGISNGVHNGVSTISTGLHNGVSTGISTAGVSTGGHNGALGLLGGVLGLVG